MTYTVRLETTDVNDADFQRFLKRHKISFIKIADAEMLPGAGDEIEYRCQDRKQLELLIREWFAYGEVNGELAQDTIATIKAVR